MSSIYSAKDIKERLDRSAKNRGYRVERGPNSQLQEYVAYLLALDETAEQSPNPTSTLSQALGLLSGGTAPSDQDVADILSERRQRL